MQGDPATVGDLISKIDLVTKITIGGGLFGILLAGYYRLWVYGYLLRENDERWQKRETELKAQILARDEEWKERLRSREEEWKERTRIREEQIRVEFREWNEATRTNQALLERALALYEQQRREPPRMP